MKSKIKKSKFNVVIFYGPFAVGKYTVAKEFQKQTGYKLFHNHHTYDIAIDLFERDTMEINRLVERLRLDIFEEIAKGHLNTVATHGYSANYVSITGLTDPQFVKKVQSFVEKEGGKAYFVHLQADPSALLKRVSGKSRGKFRKLLDPKIMQKILKEGNDWSTPAPVKNNIEIDNTKLSPKQVVKKVRELTKI
jgi:shikimate kinase